MLPKWLEMGAFYLAYVFAAVYVFACFQEDFLLGCFVGFLVIIILLVVAKYLNSNAKY